MNFFIMGLAVACVLTFLAWRCFYETNIELKDQLEDKQKQLDSSHEREKKAWKEYENRNLQLVAYESEISRLKDEKSELELQLKNKIVEHRVISVMPNSVTLKGLVRDERNLDNFNFDIKNNVLMRNIIARDLVNQIIANDLIQIDTETNPMKMETIIHYQITVLNKID